MRRPLRILHVPMDLGGHGSGLAAAERKLGFDSRCVTIYAAQYANAPVEERPAATPWRRERQRTRLFWDALRWADEVHYHFGETLLMPRRHPSLNTGKPLAPREAMVRFLARFLWAKDVPLMALLGKRLAFHFFGDDIRRRDYSLAHYEISIAHEADGDYYPPHTESWKARLVTLAERWATGLFAYNPDLMNLLPARATFLAYTHLDPAAEPPRVPMSDSGPLRVVHVSTNRAAKGTLHIVQVCADLVAEGVPISLELVEGVPHEEAVKRVSAADVYLDQLLAGWYGGAGLESMSAGVPIIAYIRHDDLRHIPQEMRDRLPVIQANTSTIKHVLRRLSAEPRAELWRIGQRSRQFALQYHDPVAVARQVSRVMGRSEDGSSS
jgi:hypothetical protein